jgi:hypothetical protein|tara:strand:- start:1840 stop:2091 length:252 start_codon:yes stop_codon:yes gene_type:complete
MNLKKIEKIMDEAGKDLMEECVDLEIMSKSPTQIKEEVIDLIYAGVITSPDPLVCRECGSELEDDNTYCSYCECHCRGTLPNC